MRRMFWFSVPPLTPCDGLAVMEKHWTKKEVYPPPPSEMHLDTPEASASDAEESPFSTGEKLESQNTVPRRTIKGPFP